MIIPISDKTASKIDVPRSRCECDYDFEGDPGRYIKTSRFCPEHDMCDWCMERLGSAKLKDSADARFYSWVCEECAAEESNAE